MPTRPRTLRLLLIAGTACAVGGLGGVQGRAWAQESRHSEAVGFAGGRLPLTTVRGALSFSSTRANVWTESQTAVGAQVQRLFLSGDVTIRVGSYEFNAARAAVWLERLEDSPTPPNPASAGSPAEERAGVYQVYIYFDRVGNSRATASLSLAADRLPVKAIVDVDGRVGLAFDAAKQSRPVDPFLDEAEAVFNESLRRLATGENPLEQVPMAFEAERPFRQPLRVDPTLSKPYRNVRDLDLGEAAGAFERQMSRLPFAEENAPIFAKQGVITVAAGSLVYRGQLPADETAATPPAEPAASPQVETAVIASEGVIVQYVDPKTNRGLQLESQRAVIFLAKDAKREAGRTSFGVGDVAGVYLEGDVLATDGKFTMRGPKIYYDVQKNKAILLDAVFWSYDEDRRLPLYLRAEVIRQESQQEFSGRKARFSTSAFFEPEFSLGAQEITIRRKQVERESDGAAPEPTRSGIALPGTADPDAAILGLGAGRATRTVTIVEAADITLNAEGVPVFYVPNFTGDPEAVLLKDVRFENSGANGAAVKTRWNLAPLLGYEDSQNTKIDFLLQNYFDRGPALGVDAAYKDEDSEGKLFAYGVINDGGQDLLKPGTRREWSHDTRGIILGEERITLGEHWTMFAEGSYLGDETFVDAFMESWAETRREFTSQAFLARNDENTAFTLQAKTSLNDFVANEYLLQSRGYSVQKSPEIAYLRQSDLLFENSLVGDVFWTQEWRYSNMAMQFDEVYARERGFDRSDLSQRAFGINPGDRLADSLRAAGYEENNVNRFDTRHELTAPQKLGPVDLTPFVVGRLTAYDNDFRTFSPQETDNARMWASTGARASTQIQRVDDSVHSEFFDLDRIRHILEPNITVWHAGSSVDHQDLPVYDEEVENLAEGSMARIGLDQTWQTKRGGGLGAKSHTADVFKFNNAFVFSSGDVNPKSPFGRWIDFRPELSNPGNYFTSEAAWQMTSALALTGSTVYDLDLNQQDRSTLGVLIQHQPRFSTFSELRYLNPLDSTFLDLGASYQLTERYALTGLASYDLHNGGFQGAGGELSRRSDAYLLALRLSYNNTTDSTSFGFVVKPSLIAKKKRVRMLDEEADSAVTTESLK